MKTNEQHLTRVQKADLSLSYLLGAGGALAEVAAEKFIRLLTKKSVIMPSCTVFGMREFRRRVPTIKFGSRVLRPGVPGQALPSGDRARPDIGKTELDAKLFKAAVLVEDEVFEDDIEVEALRNTLMQLLGDAIARDTEYVVIAGDTTSTDPLLAVLDGILKKATSHVADAGGSRLDKDELLKLRKSLPHEYKEAPQDMRIWTSTNATDDYGDTLGDRMTALGDKMIEEYPGPRYKLTPVVGVPEMPEDFGGGSNYTNALLLHPQNVNIGFHKRIEVRTAEDIETGSVLMVARLRFDVAYADENGVGKLINILAT